MPGPACRCLQRLPSLSPRQMHRERTTRWMLMHCSTRGAQLASAGRAGSAAPTSAACSSAMYSMPAPPEVPSSAAGSAPWAASACAASSNRAETARCWCSQPLQALGQAGQAGRQLGWRRQDNPTHSAAAASDWTAARHGPPPSLQTHKRAEERAPGTGLRPHLLCESTMQQQSWQLRSVRARSCATASSAALHASATGPSPPWPPWLGGAAMQCAAMQRWRSRHSSWSARPAGSLSPPPSSPLPSPAGACRRGRLELKTSTKVPRLPAVSGTGSG